MGDALEFFLDHGEIFPDLFARLFAAGQEDEVGDGLERIIDFVSDGGGQASYGGQPLAGSQRALGALLLGDVMGDFGRSDYVAGLVANRRNGDRDIDSLAVLSKAHSFKVVDAFAASESGKDASFVGGQFGRNDFYDGLADHLIGGISEEAFGGRVPAGHDALQVFADNGVIAGFDDGGQPVARLVAAAFAGAGGFIANLGQDCRFMPAARGQRMEAEVEDGGMSPAGSEEFQLAPGAFAGGARNCAAQARPDLRIHIGNRADKRLAGEFGRRAAKQRRGRTVALQYDAFG